MKLAILICGEVYPLTIGRPCTREARTVWGPDQTHGGITLERDDAARQKVASAAHLNDEHRFAVGGKIRMMSHAPFAGGNVDVAALSAAFVGGDEDHVEPLFNLREEQPLAAFDPRERRGVGDHEVGIAAYNGHFQK